MWFNRTAGDCAPQRGSASWQTSSCAVLASSTQSPSAKIGAQGGRRLWSPQPAGDSRSSGRDFGSNLASAVCAVRRRGAGKRDPGDTGRGAEFQIRVGQNCGGRCKAGIGSRVRREGKRNGGPRLFDVLAFPIFY